MFKEAMHEAQSWVRDCIALCKVHPTRWMLVSLSYMILFMVVPALNMPELLKVLLVMVMPFFLVVMLSLYREADFGRNTHAMELARNLKPLLPKLMTLGLVGMLYSVLVGYITDGDMQALEALVNTKNVDVELVATKTLPLMIKLLVLGTPILMATWFAPMLVAYHQFPIFKAIKSSIAGCLVKALPLTFAWLILTVGLTLLMLGTGIIVGVLGLALASLAKLLAVLILLGFLFLSTALMLALQYVSYRDVFAKKMA